MCVAVAGAFATALGGGPDSSDGVPNSVRARPPATRIDYQKVADSTQWSWSEDESSPLYSAAAAQSPYSIELISMPAQRDALVLKCIDGVREKYRWNGHRYSVFQLTGERLCYVEYSMATPGGTVVMVDLASAKELWRSPLRARGRPLHSMYRNRICMSANAEVVSVYGNETAGRYFEIKDAKTGETVGHKEFRQER
jgi:hypothetical protein